MAQNSKMTELLKLNSGISPHKNVHASYFFPDHQLYVNESVSESESFLNR